MHLKRTFNLYCTSRLLPRVGSLDGNVTSCCNLVDFSPKSKNAFSLSELEDVLSQKGLHFVSGLYHKYVYRKILYRLLKIVSPLEDNPSEKTNMLRICSSNLHDNFNSEHFPMKA